MKKGFTIVELIIVIAVIGVLAAILIPTFSSVIEKANMASVKSDVKNMNTTLVSESICPEDSALTVPMSVDEALIKVSKAGYSTDTVMCNKKGLDIVFATEFNRFALVATGLVGGETKIIDVLYPQEVVEAAQIAGGTDTYVTAGRLQSTRLVAMANEETMDNYALDIAGASAANPKTVEVASASDLASLAMISNAYTVSGQPIPGATASNFENVTIEIIKDIYIGGTQWTPFGEAPSNAFMGKIDGNGHTIYGLTNKGYAGGYTFMTSGTKTLGAAYGLIAFVKGDIAISDLTIENVSIDAKDGLCVGAFIGYSGYNKLGVSAIANVTLTNCSASGAIKGKNDVGGLIGKFYGASAAANRKALTLKNCTVDVAVEVCYAELQTDTIIGTTKGAELIGYASNYATITIDGCTANGSVVINNKNAGKTAFAGGILGGEGNPGYVNLVIKNFNCNCDITADAAYTAAGAFVGQALNKTIIAGNVNITGTVTATGSLLTTAVASGAAGYRYNVTLGADANVLLGLTYPAYVSFVEGAKLNGVALSTSTVVNCTMNTGIAPTSPMVITVTTI